MDTRGRRRWAAARPRQPLCDLGVDEIFLGKTVKFLTVVRALETGAPRWVGLERTRETLDRFVAEAVPPTRRRGIRAVCVDLWEPVRFSLQTHVPHARIVSDTCHVVRHAREARDEPRRAECFRHGAAARGLLRGTRWRLRPRWATLDWEARQTLRALVALNRRLAKASLLTEHPAQLWAYTDEEAARRCLTTWLLALRWQRVPAFHKLGRMLTRHLDGLLNSCPETVPFGTVEAINGNIRAMRRRDRGDRDHDYLLLKVQKATASRPLHHTACTQAPLQILVKTGKH